MLGGGGGEEGDGGGGCSHEVKSVASAATVC